MNEHPEVQRIMRVARWLAERGWAEANAGNMSVRLSEGVDLGNEEPSMEVSLKKQFPELEHRTFLVTSTHSRARDISGDPEGNLGLLKIVDRGDKYLCMWGTAPPTSEFPAHLAVHEMCIDKRPEINAILHTHPPHLIAMSHMPEMQKPGALNRALRAMHPEVGILVPDGIMSIDYRIPGSVDLGEATRDALIDRNMVIWPMHGVVSIASDLDIALDQVEIVEKAAQVYLLVLSGGCEPIGLSPEQIMESRSYWGIEGGED
jgi:rhamnulose-1-phosphate aldolase